MSKVLEIKGCKKTLVIRDLWRIVRFSMEL